MQINPTILRVFVASPDDVAEERDCLENVIKEFNITWSKNLGVRLELIGWETHSYPGVGVDSQAVINEQINDDYDIFVGIMWKRFGTPTHRADSCTVEEFDRAYERFSKNSKLLRIMFYFKDAPITPSETDPAQLALVLEFKKKLKEKGVYFWSYRSLNEFNNLSRIHLSNQVQEWGKSWGHRVESKPITEEKVMEKEVEKEEEEGFLDLIEQAQEGQGSSRESISRMSTLIQNFTEKTKEQTSIINQIKLSQTGFNIKQGKRVFNKMAENMEQFASRMEAEIPIFSKSFSKSMNSYARAITFLNDFKSKEEEKLLKIIEIIHGFLTVLRDVKDVIGNVQTKIGRIPRITTALNKAKRHMLSVLESFNNELITAENLTSEIEKVLGKVIPDSNNE